jgi:hypothetical protein
MASLSRIVKSKVAPPEQKHVSFTESVEITQPDMVVEETKPCILFLSDSKLTDKVSRHLKEFKNVKPFVSSQFINRDLDMLYEQHGVDCVWACLTDKECLQWVATQLPRQSKYFKCISVYSHSKQSKWMDDVKPYCDHSCKLKDLKQQLMALSFRDLVDNMNSIPLHAVPNKLLSCLGLSSLSKKKRFN